MLGLGLGCFLGVGRLVGVGFGLDRQRLGVLRVGCRRHPVEAGQEVEVHEARGLAGFGGPAPLACGHADPEVAALDVLADDGFAERRLQLVKDLLAGGVRSRGCVFNCRILLFFGVS